jgi:hypothetical protein
MMHMAFSRTEKATELKNSIVASNESPEGRANNRHVEVHINGRQQAEATTASR